MVMNGIGWSEEDFFPDCNVISSIYMRTSIRIFSRSSQWRRSPTCQGLLKPHQLNCIGWRQFLTFPHFFPRDSFHYYVECAAMLLCCVINDSSQSKKRICALNQKSQEKKILKQFHRNRQNQSSTRKMLCGITRIFFQQMQQCCHEREECKLIQPWKISFFCMTTTSLLVEGATTLIVQFSVHLLFCFLFFSLSSATVLCCVLLSSQKLISCDSCVVRCNAHFIKLN